MRDVRARSWSRRSARGWRRERTSRRNGNGAKPSQSEDTVKPPTPSGQPGMRFGSFGMPAEKARDFGSTTRRLLRRLGRERWIMLLAVFMTVCSVAMSVLLPKVLGSATDVVVSAFFTADIDQLHAPGTDPRLRLPAAHRRMDPAVRDVVHPRRGGAAHDVPAARGCPGQAEPAAIELCRPHAAGRPAQPRHQRHRQHRSEPAADAVADADADAYARRHRDR